MSGYPDVLATAYRTRATPNVRAADLNALQREAVRSNRSLRGSNVLFADEFLGDALNRSLWALPNASTVFIQDDGANGALGIARLTTAAQLGGQLLPNSSLSLGLNDFQFRTRLRSPNYLTFTNVWDLFAGLAGGNATFHIKRTATTTANIQVQVTGVDIDTGIAVPTASYAELAVRRDGTVISFLINDVVVYAQSFTASIPGAQPFITTNRPAGAPGGGADAYVDYVKFYGERLALSSQVAWAAPGSHSESWTVVFSNTNSAHITWNQPFTDVSYRLPAPGVLVSSGGVITATYRNKTAQGVDLLASAAFVGEMYVDAHE